MRILKNSKKIMMIAKNEYEEFLRQDLTSFIQRAFYELNPRGSLLMSWYIEVMAAKLMDCFAGKTKRLIINLPPRYLKSHCVSISFVAWLLGHKPSAQIICASYGQDLADKLARDCRTVMSSLFYKDVFKTRLSSDKYAISDFNTTDQGFRMATSVGGVLTGRGADFLIIDDALKPDDALSETRRNSVNDWFDNSLLSRLNSKVNGCIIMVQQRLHQDDLVGHVLGQGSWDVVSFPAVAEIDEKHVIETPLGLRRFTRAAGEALHPEREPLTILQLLRDTMGEYNFAAQYQQNPAPQGGAMIKTGWLKYYGFADRPGTFDQIVQSWDTANKAGELNDYSVCTTWGKNGIHLYLLNVFRRRLEYPDLKRAVREQAGIHQANVILIEDKASGTQLIQELISEGLNGVSRYQPPAGDKVMRLHSQSTAFENGLVLLPDQAPWLDDYIQELISFPGCKHDDQVDSTTQALAWLRKPESGYLEYYRRLAEEANATKSNGSQISSIRILVPNRITDVQTIAGRNIKVGNDGIILVTEEEALPYKTRGWQRA